MSKPMTRIAVSVLICLALALAMFTVVYGAAQTGMAGGRVPADAGLTMLVGSNREKLVQAYQMERPTGSHHCGEDSESDD